MAKKMPNLEEVTNALRPLFGKEVYVRFGDHSFRHTLQGVRAMTLQELQNKPEPVALPTGRNYTPPCFGIIFNGGDALVLVAEHISSLGVTLLGYNIKIGDTLLIIGAA